MLIVYCLFPLLEHMFHENKIFVKIVLWYNSSTYHYTWHLVYAW